MKITNLEQFEAFLETRIPTRENLFMGDIGLKRAKYFMKMLGNPQNKLKIVHLAGTSGKGSTAHLVSHALKSQGFKVGMSISPHVFDIRERMQINNQLPNEKLIIKYFNQIWPKIKKMEKSPYGMPTFFEINIGLAFYMFAKEKLDYVVMETGLGGALDATNTVTRTNKICIITKIGLDHTKILGNTISKIAKQKAGIIQNKNIVISHQSSASALNILSARCEKENSQFCLVQPKKNYSVISSTPEKTVFDFIFDYNFKENWHQKLTTTSKRYQLKNINLGLVGTHQAENCALALTCLIVLAERDGFMLNEKALRNALKKISIIGRLEVHETSKHKTIIDGAHNPQKMTALTNNLSALYPKQKFIFLVAFKKGKDFKNMLKKIIPIADQIMLTQFSTSGMDDHWSSTDNQKIITFLKSQKFKKLKIIANNKKEILATIAKSKKPLVITGSLYLVSSIYPYLKNNLKR